MMKRSMNLKSMRNTASAILVSLLLANCTQETDRDFTDPTLPPVEESHETRDIQLQLKNRLIVGTSGTRAATDEAQVPDVATTADDLTNIPATTQSIATEAENSLSTLDVYVFGSAKENGTYTFLQRFAYRAPGFGSIPAGAETMQVLKGADEEITNSILKVKKGLYIKLYTLANVTTLIDPATGAAFPDTDFEPLLINEKDEENPVYKEGVPTLDDFIEFHSALLNEADPKAGILTTPLAMSGTYGVPLDLTDREVYTRLQAPMKLHRLTARFDVVNSEATSRLTIQSISLAKGRRGSYFYPTSVYGSLPAAKDDELITYTPRPFEEQPNANLGRVESAFYTYPSPASDEAYLIITGLYRVNATEQKQVTYQIPFVQKQADGNMLKLDITANHRYTVGISDADEYKLEVNFQVEDWTDGSLDEQDAENKIADFLVRDILPVQDASYDPDTHILTMCVDNKKPECSFTAHTNSSMRLKAELEYPTNSDPRYHWLKLTEMDPDPDYEYKAQYARKYKVTLDMDYNNGVYPQAILRVGDVGGVAERRIIINPQPTPIVLPTPPHSEDVTNKLNRFDANTSTLYLHRVTDSSLPIRLTCNDGILPPANTDWFTIEQTGGSPASPIFTFKLTDRDKVIPDNKYTLTFVNAKSQELKIDVNLVLIEANLTSPAVEEGGSNATLDAATNEVVLKIKKDSKFKLGIDGYNGAKVIEVTYDKDSNGNPSDDWLTYTGADTKAATNNITTNSTPSTTDTRAAILARASMGKPGKVQSPSSLIETLPDYSDNTFSGYNGTSSLITRAGVSLPKKRRTNIDFAIKADTKLKHFGNAHVTIKNACNGPDEKYIMEPEFQVPVVSAAKPMVPEINNYEESSAVLYMMQQAQGKTSKASLSVYSPGGSILSVPAGTKGFTFSPNSGDSDEQTQLYTLLWEGNDTKISDDGIELTIKNKSDRNNKQFKINIRRLASDITDMYLNAKPDACALLDFGAKTIDMNIAEGNTFSLTMKCYGGKVTVDKCPSFLTETAGTRAMPQKSETTLHFIVNTDILGKGVEDLVLANPSGGPKMTLKVTPVYIAPIVSGSKTMTPANANKWDKNDNTLYLVQQKEGQTSKGILTIYSLGGSTLTLPTDITASLLSSDEKSQDYEISWAGTNNLTLTEQNKTLTFANKSDAKKTFGVNLHLIPNVISDFVATPKADGTGAIDVAKGEMTIDVTKDNFVKLAMKAYGNDGTFVTATAPKWVKISAPAATRTAPTKDNTSITFTIDHTFHQFPTGDIVLTNPSGGPDVTFKLVGKHIAPTVKGGSLYTPTNATRWDDTTQTLYLVQTVAGSNAKATLTIYSLGGSTLTLPSTMPKGLTVDATSTTDPTKEYTFTWAGSDATDLTEQTIDVVLKNTDDLTASRTIHIKLLPNIISDVAVTQKANADGQKTELSADKKTITVDIAAANYFDLGMKAYGDATRITVISKPDWLKAGTPSATRSVPAKENTFVRFTVDDTKTDFTAGNIVLKNPSGGPNLTVTVKPRYMAPTHKNCITMTTCNSYTNYTLKLIQARSGNSTGTLQVYALGGGSAQIVTAKTGLSTAQTNLDKATNRNYVVNWAANNNALADQSTKLRIYNFDKSKYLEYTVNMTSNGAIDIWNDLKAWDPANPTISNGKRINAGVSVPMTVGKTFYIRVRSYGGTTLINNNLNWAKVNNATPGASTSTSAIDQTYNFTVQTTNGDCAAKTFVIRPRLGGPDLTVTVKPDYQPPFINAAASPSPALNNWDSGQNTIYLLQAPAGSNSVLNYTVNALGGTQVGLTAADGNISFNKTSSTNYSDTYQIRWNGSNTKYNNDGIVTKTLRLSNKSNTAKYKDVTLKLLPNTIFDLKLTNAGNGVKLENYNGSTGTLTVPVIANNTFTLSMQSYSGAPVVVLPPWLTKQSGSTRAQPSRGTYNITAYVNPDGTFGNNTLTISNPGGGPAVTLTIKPVYQKPTISDPGTRAPSVNTTNYNGNGGSMVIYRTVNGYTAYNRMKIGALGGCSYQFQGANNAGVAVKEYQAATKQREYYFEVYKYGETNNRHLTRTTSIVRVWNADKSQYIDVSVNLDPCVPTFSSYNDGNPQSRTNISVPGGFGSSTRDHNQTDIYINDHEWNYGKRHLYIVVTSPENFTLQNTNSGGNMGGNLSCGIAIPWNSTTKQATIDIYINDDVWLAPNANMWYLQLNSTNLSAFGDHKMDFYFRIPTIDGITAQKGRFNGTDCWFGISRKEYKAGPGSAGNSGNYGNWKTPRQRVGNNSSASNLSRDMFRDYRVGYSEHWEALRNKDAYTYGKEGPTAFKKDYIYFIRVNGSNEVYTDYWSDNDGGASHVNRYGRVVLIHFMNEGW
ncbi:hypothetical protein [Bacteroides sp.]|uniref:hypothetical protein n=1 Tax=Bacteroides sp. TaxID=29523 RepID=UPI0025BCAA29|nr:hypothetical protein [Bacteroides sp.]